MRKRFVEVAVRFLLIVAFVAPIALMWLVVNSLLPIGPQTGAFGGAMTFLVIGGTAAVESAVCYIVSGSWPL